MSWKYILFDLDGTLVDSMEGITLCVKYALESFGIREDDTERLKRFIGPPLKEGFVGIYGFCEKDAQAAVEKFRERFTPIGVYENTLYPGVPEMLHKLKGAGYALCIASSKPTVFVDRILDKYGISGYFDFVVGSELDGTRTQKADVIDEVLRRLEISGADKTRAVMAGDRRHDVWGAHECGIACIGVRWGYAEQGELEDAGADFIIGTVGQLEELLLMKNGK